MAASSSTPAKIKVIYINTLDHSMVSSTYVTLEQLHERFTPLSAVRIAGKEWEIVSISPSSQIEIAQSVEMTIVLKEKRILYNRPSLADKLPFMDSMSPYTDFAFEMNPESWRQAEFLLPKRLTDIKQEIQAITNIWKHHQEESDAPSFQFNKTHIRSKIETPRYDIQLADLQSILESKEIGALKISDQEDGEYVEEGFAIRTQSGIFYGVAFDNTVEQLAVHSLSLEELEENGYKSRKDAQKDLHKYIDAITSKYELIFVNWCCCDTYPKTTRLI